MLLRPESSPGQGFYLCFGRQHLGLCCGTNPSDVLDIRPQDLSYAPGLRHASNRPLWSVAIEDLRDVAEPAIRKVILERRQPFGRSAAGRITASVYLDVCGDERSHQPRPYRSLMVSAVTLSWTTRVPATILRVSGRQTSQTIRGKQLLLNFPHHALRAFG